MMNTRALFHMDLEKSQGGRRKADVVGLATQQQSQQHMQAAGCNHGKFPGERLNHVMEMNHHLKRNAKN